MSNILGDIIVRLLANTASFEDGMNKSVKQAKAAGKEIQGVFGDLGAAAEKIFGSLGGLGGELGGAFSSIGSAASSVLTTLGPLAGGFGAVGLAVAGVAALGIGAGAAVLGIAFHASEAAAKLEELSQATGVSVEQLSLLGNIASTVGIGTDQMAKAIEKMDKAALAAAQSGPKSSNAFKELGVAVTNTDGTMREAQDIFNDVSAKFATMPDGPLKTAEAIKIFGKSGADLIPLLNEGGEHVAELEAHFTALNAVVSGPTAKASADLKENMSLVSAAFAGIENTLVADLVPALNVVAQEFIAFFEENQVGITAFADNLANLAKATLNLFQIIGDIFADLYHVFMALVEGVQNVGGTIGTVISDVKNGHFSSIWTDVKSGAAQATASIKQDFWQLWDDLKKQGGSIADVWTASAPAVKPKAQGGQAVPGKLVDVGFVTSAVIKDQAEANKALAGAMADATAAGLEQQAQQLAQTQIEELEAKAKEKQIQNTKAFKDAMADAIPKIEAAALATETFKAAAADEKEFVSFTSKVNEQSDALEHESQVQSKVEQSQQKALASLGPLKTKLDGLKTVYDDMQTQGIADEATKGQTLILINKLQGQYDAATAAVQRYNAALQNKAVGDEMTKLVQQTTALRIENDALVSGNPFGKLDAEVATLTQQLHLSAEQAKLLKGQVDALKGEQIKSDVLKTAAGAGFDPSQLSQLNDEIKFLNDNWQALGMTAEQYHQTMLLLQKDYDDLKAKAGTASDGMKAGFADFAASAPTISSTMEKTVNDGLNGIAQNFTDMVVKGKADWQSLFDSMESTILNAAIKGLMSNLLGNLFGGNEDSSGGGGLLGSLGSLFGGGREAGGDVTPGKAYVVGEKRPELFVPKQGGTIVPQVMTKAGNTIHQNINIAANDVDSFMRSKSQVAAEMHRQAGNAFSRTRS
jgi:hypothetical protein